jgi:serine/threonine protein kinase
VRSYLREINDVKGEASFLPPLAKGMGLHAAFRMNAETLIGTVLGTCTLQKLIGQGGMGAVFLAQQSRPKRQVAVKVLLPMIPLNPNQLAAFLERFRRETDAAAALEHPNIIPVHEYGEANGLAYLVMPYISGGTLRDVLERDGPLSLAKAANFLEQLAAAIDAAHDRGVIHRDIKPANIMVTSEGRLLLGDFGLVKVIAEGQSAMVRLTGAGAPVGTPDYMAPEQVIGEDVDARADLYSLGILLFQMVTGTTPFRGETPMQIAAQHLRLPPPSPLMLRPDLPLRAERVIQRAMAKKPADRYVHANDLANAFRQALLDAGVELEPSSIDGLQSSSTGAWRAIPKRQFEPIRQTTSSPKPGTNKKLHSKTAARMNVLPDAIPDTPALSEEALLATKSPAGGLLARTREFTPTSSEVLPITKGETGPALVSEEASNGVQPTTEGEMGPALVSEEASNTILPTAKADTASASASDENGLLSRTRKFFMVGVNASVLSATQAKTVSKISDKHVAAPLSIQQSPALQEILAEPESQERSDTESVPQKKRKSTSRSQTVKVPLVMEVGQHDQSLKETSDLVQSQAATSVQGRKGKSQYQSWMKNLMVIVSLLAIFAAIGIMFVSRTKSSVITSKAAQSSNMTVTARAHLTATVQANIIVSDPLTHNIHNWYTEPSTAYAFKDGAYHITDDNDQNGRASILSTNTFVGPIGYQLTMQEITGNTSNINNSFGMIFRFSQQNNKKNKNGDAIISFYTFEVVNTKGGAYYFWKYDNTNPDNPWTQIQDGKLPFGNEFHQGQGPHAVNTIKIFMKGDKFTFTVNGTKLAKTFQDASLTQGMVGMIVNLKGTEVAFSNLLITKN